jgi:hypothetical protein
MKNVTKLFSVVIMILASSILEVSAQSYVTYNHDEAKMNQITVQEIGSGGLTPAFYYDVFHRSYQKSAASKNKLTYRSLAGVAGWQQVEDADSVKSSLEKRAEIEALNVADRQIDLAWVAEGTKITNKLNDFQNNINRIVGAGGTFNDKERWENYYNIFQCSIKATQDAYMPNAQRKKEYLAIYADICKENETLIKFIVQLNNRSRTKELLEATGNRPKRNGTHATAAFNRWRDAGWKGQSNGGASAGSSGSADGTIVTDENP